jgi:protein-tyrosine phosphatase
MNKEELVNKINHTLLDKDTIATDTNHPFHDFTIEDMEELMEDFTKLDKKFTDKPSYMIHYITSYLLEQNLISFELVEKEDQDDSWFEALIYENIGLKNGQPVSKSIIWDGSVYFATENFDQFITLLTEIQADIDSVTLFNSIKE